MKLFKRTNDVNTINIKIFGGDISSFSLSLNSLILLPVPTFLMSYYTRSDVPPKAAPTFWASDIHPVNPFLYESRLREHLFGLFVVNIENTMTHSPRQPIIQWTFPLVRILKASVGFHGAFYLVNILINWLLIVLRWVTNVSAHNALFNQYRKGLNMEKEQKVVPSKKSKVLIKLLIALLTVFSIAYSAAKWPLIPLIATTFLKRAGGGLTEDDANRTIDFVNAFAEYLLVLPAKVKRGTKTFREYQVGGSNPLCPTNRIKQIKATFRSPLSFSDAHDSFMTL